jgi:hypothetical protein
MSQARPFDPHIPVLTELFSDKGEPAPEPVAQSAPALPASVPASGAEADWAALERRLSERIVQQLQGSVDIVIEQRLRASLEQVLQQAVSSITAELRSSLQDTIDNIVAHAIAQEISTLDHLRQPPQ